MNSTGADAVGKTVGGYRIIKEIGKGKFSFVYRAENEQRVPYAIKKIKIFDIADQKQREKCLKEVELMKPLEHPNIIKYIDTIIDNNELYIVTEWAEKGDLQKMIKEHASDEIPFDEPTIWEYMRQISSALKHMHEKKIMHRDLKPANIFISNDMTLKIGDLGLGRVFGSETLEAYSKVGTPLYMSPELIQDSGYNFNADVWSLGCICYELCELNSPFRNKQVKISLMDLFENITQCNYKPISNQYSPELSQVIRKMIVVNPNNRLSSEQVLAIAQANLGGIKKPLLDPLIVMDDIYIKLNLLDYTTYFCKPAQRPPINRYYFAMKDGEGDQQLYYFIELCYWIMALSKPQKNRQKVAIISKANIDWDSAKGACRKLLVDLSGHGMKMEEINPETILNGYGQTICYLLNQVLNRELIRSNFQFLAPVQTPLNSHEPANEADDEPAPNPDDEIDRESVGSGSVEEQSQFEQSIFFHKGQKKIGNEDLKLLERIQEYGGDEQDKEMITGKIDDKEWKLECLRVEKKLQQITAYAKEARKKHGHQNFETAKLSTARITDLSRSVRPFATHLFNKIDGELEQIQKGERRINESFKQMGNDYSTKNQEFQQLNTRAAILSNTFKQKMEAYERLEEKVEEMNHKISMASQDSDNNKVGDIKKAITSLQKEISQMEQKEGILMWQLRSNMLRDREVQPKSFDESEFDLGS